MRLVGKILTALWERFGQSATFPLATVLGVANHDDSHDRTPAQGASGPVESRPDDGGQHEDDLRDAPVGAIAVTTFLAITILVFWFGMYFLNIARSS